MKRIWRMIPLSVLALSFAALVPAFAQSGTMGKSSKSGQMMWAKGELMNVNTDNSTFTIKKEDNQEMQFSWNDHTRVKGVKNGIQGLSSEKGNQVRVEYKEEQGKMWATRIELLKSSAQKDPWARGELTNVNPDNQTFTIREKNNQEMQFSYNDHTRVEGVKNGIQGLSSEKGTAVRVEYKKEMGKMVATRIEIPKYK